MINCQNCKKRIETPIEIFNGKFICPYCGEPLVKEEALSFFGDNKEREEEAANLFELSEIYYHKWLREPEKSTYRYRAVALCSRAALKDPRAFARRAYYFYKGYLGEHMPQETRLQIANNYWQAIKAWIKNNENHPYVNGFRQKFDTAPDKVIGSAPEVSVELNRNEDELKRSSASKNMSGNSDSMIVKLIAMCNNDERAPVLGIYRLRRGYCDKKLGDDLKNESNKGKTRFYAYTCTQTYDGKENLDSYGIEALRNDLLHGLKNDIIFIITNKQGRHDFVTGRLFSKIDSFVKNAKNKAAISAIVDHQSDIQFVTLFDEDFYALLKIKGYLLNGISQYIADYKNNRF